MRPLTQHWQDYESLPQSFQYPCTTCHWSELWSQYQLLPRGNITAAVRHGKQLIRSRASYSHILSITYYILNLTHPTPPIGWLFKLPVLHNEALCPVVHAHASHQEIVHNKNSTAAFIRWKWATIILSLCLRPFFFFIFCHSAMCRPSGPDDKDLQWHRCRHASAGGGERGCFDSINHVTWRWTRKDTQNETCLACHLLKLNVLLFQYL